MTPRPRSRPRPQPETKRLLKHLFRILVTGWLLIAGAWLIILNRGNRQLQRTIDRWEAEFGQLEVDDPTKVYLVATRILDIAPEIAPHVDHIWQFRYYFPAGYDFIRYRGSGRIGIDGVYHSKKLSSTWSSAATEPKRGLMVINISRHGAKERLFSSIVGVGSSYQSLDRQMIGEASLTKTLVQPGEKARSFEPTTILPILRIYEPGSVKMELIGGEMMETYKGTVLLLCPKSRESEFDQLRKGQLPEGFNESWVAK